jgi:hypothetical protein
MSQYLSLPYHRIPNLTRPVSSLATDLLTDRWPNVLAFMAGGERTGVRVRRRLARTAQFRQFTAVGGAPANLSCVAKFQCDGDTSDPRIRSPTLSTSNFLARPEMRFHVKVPERTAADTPLNSNVVYRLLASVERSSGEKGQMFIPHANRRIRLLFRCGQVVLGRRLVLKYEYSPSLRTAPIVNISRRLFAKQVDFL